MFPKIISLLGSTDSWNVLCKAGWRGEEGEETKLEKKKHVAKTEEAYFR